MSSLVLKEHILSNKEALHDKAFKEYRAYANSRIFHVLHRIKMKTKHKNLVSLRVVQPENNNDFLLSLKLGQKAIYWNLIIHCNA